MLKRFTVKNYRNFKEEVDINFEDIAGYQFSTDCISDGTIQKMLIYGRNATGKTNFGKALMNIRSILLGNSRNMNRGVFLNADSDELSAFFSYTFQFDDIELTYRYHRISDKELIYEELICNEIVVFKCDFIEDKYDFNNLKYIQAETANTDRYLQSFFHEDDMENAVKMPFLRWLSSNIAFEHNSPIIKMVDFVSAMTMISGENSDPFWVKPIYNSFMEELKRKEKLTDFENFLNIMGVRCKLEMKKLPDGQWELYFSNKKRIPFYENASSGTLALTHLYQRLVLRLRKSSFIYLDEFDAFYHYEMAENVIKYIKKYLPQSQVIVTTHNTNLMTNRLVRPDCVFILSEEGKLTALCNATQRELREGHNLEKMYISGEFEKYE